MSVEELSSVDRDPMLFHLQEETLFPLAGQSEQYIQYLYNTSLSELGYFDTAEGQPSVEMPQVLGIAKDRSYYVPGLKQSTDEKIRGFTALLAGAPRLSQAEKLSHIELLVDRASKRQGITDDWTTLPQRQRAMSPRRARRAVLSQLDAMSVREEFRRRSGQTAFPAIGPQLDALASQLHEEWRILKPEQMVMIASVAGGAALAFAAKKRQSK